jgi:hypothetical protein
LYRPGGDRTTEEDEMTTHAGAHARILDEVRSWPGVEVAEGRRGETSIRVGGKEIGHLHGDRAAHFGFPRKVWEELLLQGRVGPHPVAHAGWAARGIDGEDDVREVIALLRLNYDRAARRAGTRRGGSPVEAA